MTVSRRDIGLLVVGVILALIFVGVATLIGVGSDDEASRRDALVNNWTMSISKLGIRPIFPPREDFYVGDLLAADFSQAGDQLFKTVAIGHINPASAITNSYKDLPSFPPTPTPYDESVVVGSTGDIFAPPTFRQSLPIEAFPDFVVTTANSQSAGANLFGRLNALLGFSRAASQSVQLKIPEAETYGVTADAARTLLDTFCRRDTATPNPACMETRVRQLLFSTVGPSVLCWNDPDKGPAPPQGVPAKEPDNIGIELVYRVYLTRSIDYQYGADTAVAAAVGATIDSARAPAGTDHEGSTPSSAAGSEGERDKLARAVDAAHRQVTGLGPGGRLTVANMTTSGTVLSRTFARPVAIGYRPLWQSPIRDNCAHMPPRAQTGRGD